MAYTPTSPTGPSLGDVQSFPSSNPPTFDIAQQQNNPVKPTPASQTAQLGVRPPSPTPSHHSASNRNASSDPPQQQQQPHQRSIPSHLALPYIAKRNSSVSSLMDAVVGGQGAISTSINTTMNATSNNNSNNGGSMSNAPQLRTPLTPISPFALRDVGATMSFGSAGQAQAQGADASFIKGAPGQTVGSGGISAEGQKDEAVKELQEKVDKRRSQLPQLESQLAALEAQIKVAEERLARVQGGN
ncbi:hypothetical protein IAU59_007237 [Kwoniella sp. CBS 9459]